MILFQGKSLNDIPKNVLSLTDHFGHWANRQSVAVDLQIFACLWRQNHNVVANTYRRGILVGRCMGDLVVHNRFACEVILFW